MTEDNNLFPSWYEVAAFLKEKGFHFGADPDTYDYAPCVEVNFFPSSTDLSDENVRIAEDAAQRAVAAIQERWSQCAGIGPDCLIIAREGWEIWMCDPPSILNYDPVPLLNEVQALLLKCDGCLTFQIASIPWTPCNNDKLAEWQAQQADLHAFMTKLAETIS